MREGVEQGVVLVGSSPVVEAMLDRAIDVARGHASQPALDPLRPLVAPEAAVWALHRRVLARTGPRTTVLEWDEDTPAFAPLAAAVAPARTSLEALRAPA